MEEGWEPIDEEEAKYEDGKDDAEFTQTDADEAEKKNQQEDATADDIPGGTHAFNEDLPNDGFPEEEAAEVDEDTAEKTFEPMPDDEHSLPKQKPASSNNNNNNNYGKQRTPKPKSRPKPYSFSSNTQQQQDHQQQQLPRQNRSMWSDMVAYPKSKSDFCYMQRQKYADDNNVNSLFNEIDLIANEAPRQSPREIVAQVKEMYNQNIRGKKALLPDWEDSRIEEAIYLKRISVKSMTEMMVRANFFMWYKQMSRAAFAEVDGDLQTCEGTAKINAIAIKNHSLLAKML